MISAIHILALIPVSVLLFFIMAAPQGDASGGSPAVAAPIATCDTCTAAIGEWCIKGLSSVATGAETTANRFCGRKAKGADVCLGGVKWPTCPAEAAAAATDVAHRMDFGTCTKCKEAQHTWCIKGEGATQIRTCAHKDRLTAECPVAAGTTRAADCSVTTLEQRHPAIDTTASCAKCVAAQKKWCTEDYGTGKNLHCVATDADCHGNGVVSVCPGYTAKAIEVSTCEKCTTELKHTWCLKGTGATQSRTCVHTGKAATVCAAATGVVPKTTCAGLTPEEKMTTDGDETGCEKCVAGAKKKWCMKDYGTKKANFCADQESMPDHCLGGTNSTTCDRSLANQEDEADFETCETCMAAQHKWCSKVGGSNQLNICLSVAKADTECKGGLATDCSKIDEKDRKAGHREAEKGGASALPMGWSTLVLSAILVAAV